MAKERYKERPFMEAPNRVEPFYKVVEGLKISTKPEGVRAQNRSQVG